MDELESIKLTEELPDGGMVYEIGPQSLQEEFIEEDFSANLALTMEESALKKVANFLLEAIEEDINARKPWMEAIDKAAKYLSINLEDATRDPYPLASQTFDTTATNALMRYFAQVRTEMLPADGPVGFKIEGQASEEVQQKGERVRDWLNYYLTEIDKPYYADFEKLILHLGQEGTAVKKVYIDPILKRPVSRFIKRENFIIDSDCTSILESNRLTHVLWLSKREVILNQQNNLYREVELAYLKGNESNEENESLNNFSTNADLKAYSKRSLFPIYEVHTYLNLNDFSEALDQHQNDLPLPYIVTIDKTTKEVLSIKRNWLEKDYLKQRINWFVLYNYLPGIGAGFGVLGIGLAHLLGSNSITLTKILRQLMDAGTFKNLPGGIRKKGFKQQKTEIRVGPGQWHEVDTGADSLADSFMPLPYSEPSVVLKELRNEVAEQTRELGSTSELGMLESKEDIPVGTTLAMLEVNNKVQSCVLKSIHFSFTQELSMLYELFSETIESEDFPRQNQIDTVSYEDFLREIKIIPVSDPSVNSFAQRIIRADALLKTALSMPEIHDMRRVFSYVYKQQGLDEALINSFLPDQSNQDQPAPPDPQIELLAAEIEQKKADSESRERIENRKAEVEIFKAQLNFQGTKLKLSAKEEEVKLRAETELEKQNLMNE